MSDTPRTDAEVISVEIDWVECEYVEAKAARQLERELNAAKARINQIESDKANLIETLLHGECELNDWKCLSMLQHGILQAFDTCPEGGEAFRDLERDAASLYQRLSEKGNG